MFHESRYNTWVAHAGHMYVFNAISGALLQMPAEAYGRVRNFLAGTALDCPSDLLEQLARGRMIVSPGYDEVAALAEKFARAVADDSHLALTILPTLGCNFACPYCFEPRGAGAMGEETVESLIARVDDYLPRIRTLHVTWFGGEPLTGTRPLYRLSEAFIERCHRTGVAYSASMVTNGYLLDEATCRRLSQCGVSKIQVTLDGPPAVHDLTRPLKNGAGTFARIVRNLGHAAGYFDVDIRVNVGTETPEQVEALLDALEEAGLRDRVTVYPGRLTSDEEQPAALAGCGGCLPAGQFAAVEREIQQVCARRGFGRPGLPGPRGAPCTAVRRHEFVVAPDGALYKCWHTVGRPSEVVGHIASYREPHPGLSRWLDYSPFEDPECRACPALPYCMGGCPYYATVGGRREDRCHTLKETLQQQVLDFVRAAEAE